MLISLAEAPIGVQLTISHIENEDFAARLSRLGLCQGSKLTRIGESATSSAVRVRGPNIISGGDAVLSGYLASRVVIHVDDDRRIPLPKCKPGDAGHVEGIAGRSEVEESLRVLGIAEGDRISFVRRLPPMNYKFTVDNRRHGVLSENLAAHIIGDCTEGPVADGPIQFARIGVGELFKVSAILPGADAEAVLSGLRIAPGAEMILSGVSASQDLRLASDHTLACVTREGLHLFISENDAGEIFVNTEG